MNQLTNNELMNVYGGFSALGVMSIIGGIVFLIGLLDGFVRPLKCRR